MKHRWTLLFLAACGGPEPEPGTTTEPPSATVLDDGLALIPRLVGLWSGSASQTPLGAFPKMNVDMRAMNDGLIWGRVDLDPDNALRFGYAVESRDPDQLIYRNGGFFQSMLRDDRASLREYDPEEERWRFCHVEGGCEYVEATYDFDGDSSLLFDVRVRGADHVHWQATRLETRPTPDGFPAATTDPDAPLPEMPELEVTVSWATPLADAADVWLSLSVENCTLASCTVSRTTRTAAPAGATSAVCRFPEVHSGAYKANAVLDRDRNLQTTLVPGSGDGVSQPNKPITIEPSGITQDSVGIALDL